MVSTIGVGILGCGNLSRHCHLPRLRQMEGVRVVGVADIQPDRAEAAANENGVDFWTTSPDDLLARSGVEVVLVVTSTHTHADLTVRAAQAGKHVFCEKPMAATIQDAQRMIEACNTAGVKLGIAQCRRFDNEWLKLRELIREGAIGRPVVWRVVAAAGGSREPSWFKEAGKGQGTFVDLAVHHMDFARYTFGEADWVFASTQEWQPVSTAPDTGTVIIRFRSGDEMTLSWSMGIAPGVTGGHLHDVIGPGPGEGGAISFPEPMFYRVLNREPYALAVHCPQGVTRLAEFKRNDMYVDEWMDFIAAVREDREPLITGQEGKASLAIGLAALESGKTGQRVKL
ncbi:MAG: Gfo/Idh/MocA family protein [Anaerolineae bacterium]|jgi:predicted dehydrogenase